RQPLVSDFVRSRVKFKLLLLMRRKPDMQTWKEHTTIAVRMVVVFALVILTLPARGQSRLSRPTLAVRSSDRARDNQPAPAADWSKKMVESTMKRYPTAKDLGSWGYAKSLYLYGQYLVWKRTGDPRYLQYIKEWIDKDRVILRSPTSRGPSP